MRSAGLCFLAIGIFASAPAVLAKSSTLKCKVLDFHAHGPPNANMTPLIGKEVILDDQEKTIIVRIPDRGPEAFSVLSRRNDWLLRAQNESETILSVLNLPEYEGLTMLLVFSGSAGREITVTLKGHCTEN